MLPEYVLAGLSAAAVRSNHSSSSRAHARVTSSHVQQPADYDEVLRPGERRVDRGVLAREPDRRASVYQTYSTTWRGLEFIMGYYAILDRAPKGRDEGEDDWQTWIRRLSEYGQL
jgi:predicted dithiol-disulfide oxidoreductase (DUF899 family)